MRAREKATHEVITIPEDDYDEHAAASPDSDASDAGRRFAAALSGAIEGFLEGLEEHDVAGTAKEGLETAGEVARTATSEGRAQVQTPEMQDLKRDVSHVATSVSESVKGAAETVKAKADDVRYQARETVDDVKEKVDETVERAKESYQHAKDDVKYKASAVKESGRRAKYAPRRIARELGKAFGAWKDALVTSIAMMAGIFVLGIVTLIVLTIAMVVGLNQILGDPQGTWLTFAIDLVVMIIMYAVMRTRRMAARRETARRVENAKAELRHVGAPVRRAFGGRGRAGL